MHSPVRVESRDYRMEWAAQPALVSRCKTRGSAPKARRLPLLLVGCGYVHNNYILICFQKNSMLKF